MSTFTHPRALSATSTAAPPGRADRPSTPPIRVRIIHQFDPAGLIPGGVPTFIRGIIKAAPPDIEISLVGLTTDAAARPVGRWTTVRVGDTSISFLPVGRDHDPGGRSLLPLSARMTMGVARYRKLCTADCDILEFHRFEPALPLLRDRRPKNAFVHRSREALRHTRSDIKWKHLPGVYRALEDHTVPHFESIFCVRADEVEKFRDDFPELAYRFHFTPTWMDPDVFWPIAADRKLAERQKLSAEVDVPVDGDLLMWVGRLDEGKNPLLLAESVALVISKRPGTRLLVVGDGVLRPAFEARIRALGLEESVRLAGLRTSTDVGRMLRCADAFLLTSEYEGMPMCVLEALGCGVPVIATDVGEVRRVVLEGQNGAVVIDRSAEAFARAVLGVLASGTAYRGAPCVAAVQDFTPSKVLAPIFDNYRRLAECGSGAPK